MKKPLRILGIGLLVAFAAAQFVRTPRNTGTAEGPESLVAKEKVPADVQGILRRACYDCHSDNTAYPWYANIQPVAWWMGRHVAEGREELNLSRFSEYNAKRAVRKLRAMADEVEERHMPLKSYILMHRGAKLTDAEIALVVDWAETLADDVESR